MRYFFILAYPRSRTAWLAAALTHQLAACLHEGLLGVRSVRDLREKMDRLGRPVAGNSDSANLLFVDALRREFRDARFVCVYRPEAEVCKSLLRNGISLDGMGLLRAAMQQVRQAPDVLQVRYDALSQPETGRAVWDFCCGKGFDETRWRDLCGQNIQADLGQLLTRVAQCRPDIEALLQTDGAQAWL